MKFYLSLLTAVAVALLGYPCCAKDKELKLFSCSQSSTHGAGKCEKAIDGDKNQVMGYSLANSCSHTGPESNSWWQAEFEKLAFVKFVHIYNRKDCCSDRLTNFTINVDESVCYSHNGEVFLDRVFECNEIGLHLTILSRKPNLTLCEIEAVGNYIKLSGKKLKLLTCQQSSTYYENTCDKAIDGNVNQNFSAGSCSHVGTESSGWWTARTEMQALIEWIHIYNRQDCCADRLTNFTVYIDTALCYHYVGSAFSQKFIHCVAKGSQLKIISKKAYLTLCEVVVMGKYIDHQLILQECNQSSTFRDASCNKAIDGNTNQEFPDGSCSRAESEATGWWRANTGSVAFYRLVHIYNRNDCCQETLTDFTIEADGNECDRYNGRPFSDKLFNCSKTGYELQISSKKAYLTLCEVVVSGYYITPGQLKLIKCNQSSTHLLNSCERAFDRNFNQTMSHGSCSQLGSESSGWWSAEIDRKAEMQYIDIYNRQDCCADNLTNFTISVDGMQCVSYNGPAFSHKQFICFKVGTVLRIDSRKPYMSLCEVVVRGR